MPLRPLPFVAVAALGVAVVLVRAAPRTGPPPRCVRAWAWALMGAGYLLLWGAHGWPAAAAAVWLRPLLHVGALLLVAAGLRALRRVPHVERRRAFERRTFAGAAPDLALVFVGRLYAIAPAGWAAVVTSARAAAAARAGARGVLWTVLADRRLQGAERYFADAVGAALRRPGSTGIPLATRAVACTTALTAALAVLVRPSMPAGDFEVLYAPFARLIPAATLCCRDARSARFRR